MQSPNPFPLTGKWQLGLSLTIVTVLLWSTAPIASSLLLDRMDAITLSWYRFTFVGIVLALAQLSHHKPLNRTLWSRRWLWLLLVAGLALTANFTLYVHALNYVPPGASQIVVQLAPLFVMVASVFIYREKVFRVQIFGILVLAIGLPLFFHLRITELIHGASDYAFGIFVVLCSAIGWAVFALSQKRLLKAATPIEIMTGVYLIGSVAMFPWVALDQILALSRYQIWALLYATVNLAAGYGCFAEAMRHWEASRISAVICISPLLTLLFSYPASMLWPQHLQPDDYNLIAITGAIMVVTGSTMGALGRR